jgi:aspartyl aminopeptidase
MDPNDTRTARDLIAYIDASPSPYHACRSAADRLAAAGFAEVDASGRWPADGRGFVVRGGTLVAWAGSSGRDPAQPFRIVGAHTDSPNLRIKPRPDTGRAGYRQIGVEVYGGALLNSWLDRDLGLSGRVSVRTADGPEERLVRVDRPLCRVPQLAIHLDREVNERGLQLNRQQHLVPVWGLGTPRPGELATFVAQCVDADADDLLAWDLMLHDLTPGALLGAHDEMVAVGRIDNLASCWAAIDALATVDPTSTTGVVCLYDHEEIGSQSATGADSTVLVTVLERLVLAAGGDREAFHRALAGSVCASVDGAHATHPNYADRHEPSHQVALNAGPVIKRNSNERYATHADSEAHLRVAAHTADVPLQEFVVRSDLACGSTIGPITAARLGVPTVDLGIPMLSMHSARELCGTADPRLLATLLRAWLMP